MRHRICKLFGLAKGPVFVFNILSLTTTTKNKPQDNSPFRHHPCLYMALAVIPSPRGKIGLERCTCIQGTSHINPQGTPKAFTNTGESKACSKRVDSLFLIETPLSISITLLFPSSAYRRAQRTHMFRGKHPIPLSLALSSLIPCLSLNLALPLSVPLTAFRDIQHSSATADNMRWSPAFACGSIGLIFTFKLLHSPFYTYVAGVFSSHQLGILVIALC